MKRKHNPNDDNCSFIFQANSKETWKADGEKQ